MTARPFAGLRVVLVAAFNRRYHRTGYALERALAALGCEVRRCEERRRGWTALFGRPLADRLARRLARRPADVVLVFKGTALHPETTRDLKSRFGGQWVNWFPDDPHEHATALRLSPAYDRFFTHDSASVEGHRQAGARADYLAFGCDPDFLRPLPRRRRWTAPIVFVGSRDPVREHVVRELAAFGLVARGPGWPNGPVYGKAFVRALAGATVGLNVHQHFGEAGDPARYGTGANMRVFELAAVGTAQLADAKADIARHLSPGREIVLYRSVGELREGARALLENPALRHSLGLAARARALREHTWSHRLEELLTITLR
jgi:spore maturation protein CgeB